MRWDSNYNSSNVEDRRGEGPARGGGGGGMMSILAIGSRFGLKGIIVALLLIGGLTVAGPCGHATQRVADRPTAGQSEPLVHFVGFVLDDVQKTWRAQLPGYTDAKLVLFRDSIGSACGTATEAVGPFYCPLDKKVYIDLGFYDELRTKLGAPGDFAQAYVIAHELGHHVQDLRGLLGKGEVASVAIELQADCLAGAWAKDAEKRGEVEIGDIDEALNAAAQIGDDTLQRKAGQQVQPERWTHGSSAQRSGNFKKGYQGGAPACGI
jgi:predicted metalloprotease